MLNPKCHPGWIEIVAGQVLQPGGQVGGRNPHQREMNPEPLQQRLDVRREPHADAHVRKGVFENQVPADDPRHQLAQRGVGVGVRRAGDRNHRCQLGIAEPGEHANNRHHHQRQRQRRPRAGTSRHRRVRQQVMNQRRVADRGHGELLPRHGRADDGEYPRPDHRSDAQRGQRPRPQRLLQRVLRLLRFRDQLVDRLAGNKLAAEGAGSRSGDGGASHAADLSSAGRAG